MGEWIKVKEKTPGVGVKVLCYTESKMILPIVWQDGDDDWVTHWTELPAPPKDFS